MIFPLRGGSDHEVDSTNTQHEAEVYHRIVQTSYDFYNNPSVQIQISKRGWRELKYKKKRSMNIVKIRLWQILHRIEKNPTSSQNNQQLLHSGRHKDGGTHGEVTRCVTK